MGFIGFLLILATAVAVQVAGGEEHLELQECSPSAITQLLPMVHPPVPETSVTLVRELMDPISLQVFAETFWERKPMGKKKGRRVATTAATAKKLKQLTPKPPATPRPDAAATTNYGSAKPQEGQPNPAQAGESAGAAASVAPSQSSHHRGYFHALVGDDRDSDNNSSARDGAKAGTQTLDTDPSPDDDDDDDDNADDDLAHDILQNRADAASQQSAPLLASGGPLEAVLVSAVSKAVEAAKAPPAWVLSMLMPGAAHQEDIQKLQSTADDNKDRITAIGNYISGQEAFVSSGGAYGAQRGGRAQRGTDKRDNKDNSKSQGPPARAKAKVSFAGTAKPDTAKHKKECDFIGCRFSSIRLMHTRAECKNEQAAKNEGYTFTKN
ncbi:unnamed protein product [Ectocarpus sp. CCAP 1310/34]|nr:unnamed protein product [Ectocarpus sp. CCAP 1310/34]